MVLAIFVFAPIGLPAWWILVTTRIVGVPLIAGLSFELIKWAGRNRRRRWVQAIMAPGLRCRGSPRVSPITISWLWRSRRCRRFSPARRPAS